MLPIAMVTGASVYLLYHFMPEPVHAAGPFLSGAVAVLQPLLIFAMLFLTFCRIEPKDLKPHRWHWWLLLIQGGLFTGLGLLACWLLHAIPGEGHGKTVLIESAMLCLICPTATAAAVVTRKLGGDVGIIGLAGSSGCFCSFVSLLGFQEFLARFSGFLQGFFQG